MNKLFCPKCNHGMWTHPNSTQPYCPHCEVTDAANKPADDTQAGGNHYKDMAVQPWHLMEALLTHEEFVGYLKGNLIKYAMRQGKKDSPDAEKFHHYKAKLAEIVANGTTRK